MKRVTLLAVLSSSLLLACTPQDDSADPTPSSEPGGKADSANGDAPERYVCESDSPWPSVDTISDASAIATDYSGDDFDLSEFERSLVIRTALHFGLVESNATVIEAIDSLSYGSFAPEIRSIPFGPNPLEDPSTDLVWVYGFPEDTSTGLVFDAEGTLLAETHGPSLEADIIGCELQGDPSQLDDPDQAIYDCEFTSPWEDRGVSTILELEGNVRTSRELHFRASDFTSDSFEIPAGAADLLWRALYHLNVIEADSSFEDAFYGEYYHSYSLRDLNIEGKTFYWAYSNVSENKLGVIFDSGSLAVVAETGGGYVLGCE